MSYTELFYNDILVSVTATKLILDPHIPKCPACGALDVHFVGKPTYTYQANKVYDRYQLVTTSFTCCGASIAWFIAVHKEVDGVPVYCIQKSSGEGAGGIRLNWYVKTGEGT